MPAQLHSVSLPLHRPAIAPSSTASPLAHAGRTLLRVLEAIGRARAHSELRRLALRADSVDPELAVHLRRTLADLG